MRELVLDRLQKMKEYEHGFTKATMRWRNFEVNTKHVSEVDFNTLSDDELLDVFVRINRRFYTQM